MKSPVALFALSVLTLVYAVFCVFTAAPQALPASDAALIQYAIQHCWGCGDNGPTCAIDTAFWTLGLPEAQAQEERKQMIGEALTHAAFMAHADRNALVRPNTSPDVLQLQRQWARANGKYPPALVLTFSAPAELPDGSTCYYVERREYGRPRGSGTIYVLRKGAVVSVLDVWIT
jgi:hypothetical protein